MRRARIRNVRTVLLYDLGSAARIFFVEIPFLCISDGTDVVYRHLHTRRGAARRFEIPILDEEGPRQPTALHRSLAVTLATLTSASRSNAIIIYNGWRVVPVAKIPKHNNGYSSRARRNARGDLDARRRAAQR